MAQDPEKLAQLQALAEGGPAGLAQHQQAAAGAQAARNQALASAAGYGTSDYATSAELRASLAATADRAAAPGVAAAESVSAAAPGLAAADQAAADTYTSRAAQSTQSRLAAAQAKIELEERRDRAEQQSKLAELQLEREKSAAEGAYTLSSLDEKSRALDLERAMDPERIKGQAAADQAAAQQAEEAKAKAAKDMADVRRGADAAGDTVREGEESKLEEMQKAATAGDFAGVSGTAQAEPGEQKRFVTPAEMAALEAEQQAAQQAQTNFAGTAGAFTGVSGRIGGDMTKPGAMRDGGMVNTGSGPELLYPAPATQTAQTAQQALAEQQALVDSMRNADHFRQVGIGAKQAQQTAASSMAEDISLARPRFEFAAAVQRGMDPDVAASKFLLGESGNRERDWAIGEKERRYRADTVDEGLEQREMTLEQKQAAQARQAEAEAEAERTGWDPKDLVSMAGATNLSVKDVADRVTSDAWKRVDEYAKKAGEGGYVLDSADANRLGEPGSVGQPMDEDIFWKYLGIVPGLDPMARQIAYKRYKWMFAPIPEGDG